MANAELLPYAEAFDLVVASEILEHVLNAGDFLISLHRSLRTDARTLVRVPYKEDLRQYARQNGCEYPFVHLRTFTKGSLESMMGNAGFKPVRMYFDGQFGHGFGAQCARSTRSSARTCSGCSIPRGSAAAAAARTVPQLLFQPVTLTGIFERA